MMFSITDDKITKLTTDLPLVVNGSNIELDTTNLPFVLNSDITLKSKLPLKIENNEIVYDYDKMQKNFEKKVKLAIISEVDGTYYGLLRVTEKYGYVIIHVSSGNAKLACDVLLRDRIIIICNNINNWIKKVYNPYNIQCYLHRGYKFIDGTLRFEHNGCNLGVVSISLPVTPVDPQFKHLSYDELCDCEKY